MNTGAPDRSADERVRTLVEEYGSLFERFGHSRADGRLVGWLLLADPPDQSMMEISEALDLSKGALSVGLRRLVDRGLVERRRRPGDRHDSFRFDPDAIGALMETVLDGVARMEDLLARSEELPGQERNTRLSMMHALYARLAREMPTLLEHWRADVQRAVALQPGGKEPNSRQED